MRDHKLSRMSMLPLFRETSQPKLRYLAAVADEVTVQRGTILATRAGLMADFFVVEEGRGLWQIVGHEPITVGRGDVFGELPVEHGHAIEREVTLVAESEMRLLVIRREAFSLLNEVVPGLTGTLAEAVALHSGF